MYVWLGTIVPNRELYPINQGKVYRPYGIGNGNVKVYGIRQGKSRCD